MFLPIKQEFIILVLFSRPLPIKYVFFNNEPGITGHTHVDFSLAELNHYTFLISLDKFSKNFKAFDDLFKKICVWS